ncbi:glycoside hydrolase family 43 protein [Novosphingobium sp.]|uniref:glycoside hydrolase family 43 protein n=1 Tax=Novosphingobium sp. TaxID=1874826 RepID=UPI002FE118CB
MPNPFRKHRLHAALALSLAISATTSGAAAPEKRQEDAPLAMPAMPLHDPWIVADGKSRTYYLFTGNDKAMTGDARPGTMVYTSRDLRHWTKPRLVFAIPPGIWADAGAWAPEVHRWKGKWYLFTTLHNEALPLPGQAAGESRRPQYRRGTVLAVSDRLDGPYRLLDEGAPIVPPAAMTLDGTLHVEPDGKPWLVYAHEWLQTTDGTMEAMPLTDALAPAGPARSLFRASDAPWVAGQKQPEGDIAYVTDGPQLYRTRTGKLLMLWSSYDAKGYVEGLARSASGRIEGPWEQLGTLVERDSGHGMLFRAFDGRLMMIVHRPFRNARGKLYEMRDEGDRLTVVREASELDGEPDPTHDCVPEGKCR